MFYEKDTDANLIKDKKIAISGAQSTTVLLQTLQKNQKHAS